MIINVMNSISATDWPLIDNILDGREAIFAGEAGFERLRISQAQSACVDDLVVH